MSLFSENFCKFLNCGLHFATLSDLIQHIEETHLPIVDAEIGKKEPLERPLVQSGSVSEDTSKNSATASTSAVALSLVYRCFPVLPAQKAVPIKYEPTAISFCHYKKKPPVYAGVAIPLYTQPAAAVEATTPNRSDHDEEFSNDSIKYDEMEESESGELNDDRRYKCPVDGCTKRYKNLQGARYHVRQVHGLNDDVTVTVAASEVLASTLGSQSQSIQQPTLNKYSNVRPYKCNQCSKRYKTVSGLNNHMQQSHQRLNTSGLSSGLVPVSPSAVSSAGSSYVHTAVPMDSTQNQHFSLVAPPGVRVSTQSPHSNVPTSLSASQYHQSAPVAGRTLTTNHSIQVRFANNPGTQRVASIDRFNSVHSVQGKPTQRTISDNNLNIMNRNQFQHNTASDIQYSAPSSAQSVLSATQLSSGIVTSHSLL